MDLPHAIRQLRSALRLTQQGLAQRLDLSVRAIAHYEGGRTPKNAALHRLVELAREAERQDLARIFSAALNEELEEFAMAAAEEKVWTDAVVALLRRKESQHWPQLRQSIVTALEKLRRLPSYAHDEQLAAILVEARYKLADGAERQLHKLAKARQAKTGEGYYQAYTAVLLEHPELYQQYQKERANAARGTPFESTLKFPIARTE